MQPEPVVHLGLYFELPFDLGLPFNHAVHLQDDPYGPPFAGWDSFDAADYLGMSPAPPGGFPPSTTFAFRRWGIPTPIPTGTARRAFAADFPRRILPRLRGRWQAPRHETPITVVRVDRLEQVVNGDFDRWRDQKVDGCLEQLNAFILSIASVSRNRELYSLGVRDLPPLMLGYRREPLLAEGGKTAPRERFAFVLHERIPGDVQLLTRTDAEAALSISALREVIPFATAGDFLLSAWHEFDRGRYGQAAIDAATCIELLVVATIRELAPLAGHSQTKIDNIADGTNFSDKAHHFAKLIGFSGTPAKSADEFGRWWRDGYLLRNRAAHRGHRPAVTEVFEALDAGETLFHVVVARVVAYPGYQPATRNLRW
jgi:hypothetical protein